MSDDALTASQPGFTLIEVLVAFVIVALALGLLLQIFSTGIVSVSRAQGYTRSVLVAESRLEAIGISEPLEEGTRSGTLEDGTSWQSDIRLRRPVGHGRDVHVPVRIYDVAVSVRWLHGGRERSVTLTTIRLQSGASL